MAKREIKATAHMDLFEVTARLELGQASLVLTYPKNDEQAVEDMSFLVENSEESFVAVLETLAKAAEAKAKDN